MHFAGLICETGAASILSVFLIHMRKLRNELTRMLLLLPFLFCGLWV
jgi:hypothetical protein